MDHYDFLIVGAGLFGSVFARQVTDAGMKCLVIDKRDHLGGNVYCENIEGINVHRYGPHIFHTNDREIWDYVNSFVSFNNFRFSPIANYKNKLYNLPFNMHTFYQLWNVRNPLEAELIIKKQILESGIRDPKNLEEHAISMVGTEIYQMLIKGYTEKQWGRSAVDLPDSIIKRLPVRFTFDNNYFNDTYQGIPIGGYNRLIEGLLNGISIRTGIDFFKNKNELKMKADRIVFTGKIDQYFDYKYGILEYRSLNFEHDILDVSNYQGVAVINMAERNIPFTRIIEHKHFEFGKQHHTVITREFPVESIGEHEAYYPINDFSNNLKYKAYSNLSKYESNVIFGGRLAEYKYYDMHQVIGSALKRSKLFLHYS